MANEHSKENTALYVDLIKWIGGTIILGVSGIWVNYVIQDNELEIKRMEANAKMIEIVSNNVATDDSLYSISSEHRYLTMILPFITSEEVAPQISSRITLLNQNISQRIRKEAEKRNQLLLTSISSQKLDSLEETTMLDTIDQNTQAGNEKSIEKLVEKERAIDVSVDLDSNTMAMIQQNQQIVTRSTLERTDKEKQKKLLYTLTHNTETKWCKKGYYIVFNKSAEVNVQVGIQDIDKIEGSIQFNYKFTGENETSPLIKDLVLTEGDSYEFNKGDNKYVLTLSYIGPAGKNPFTMAAYLSLATYEKRIEKQKQITNS